MRVSGWGPRDGIRDCSFSKDSVFMNVVLISLLFPLQSVIISSYYLYIAFVNTYFFSDLRHDIDQPLLLHERDDRSFRVAATGTVKNTKSTVLVGFLAPKKRPWKAATTN
jgi:hypothetical protein